MKDVSPRQVVVTMLVFGAVLTAWRSTAPPRSATPAGTVSLTDAQKRAGLRFAPEVSAGDREWILSAIAGARPEAQQLIAAVDGTVEFRTHRGEPLGLADLRPRGVRHHGGHRVARRPPPGRPGADRAARARPRDRLRARLRPARGRARRRDPAPRRVRPVTDGPTGACTEPAERFADTFAKWAKRGAISAVGAGYSVPTPPSLEEWGAPLATLAASVR